MPILDLSGSVNAVSSASGTIDTEFVEAINSTDDPQFRTHNLKWIENCPTAGFVKWEAADGINPILVIFDNDIYEITPAQTAFTHIFWRLESPNNIVASNDEPDINSIDVFPLAKNTDGIVDAAWGIRVIDTQKIAKHAVSNLLYAYTAGSLLLQYAVFTTIVTKDIYSLGNDLIIQCSAFFAATVGDNAINIQVQRTGGTLGSKYFISTHAPTYVWEDYGVPVAFTIVDEPEEVDVTYTYLFMANRNIDDPNLVYAQKRMITLLELKK